jgi:endonuclease G
MAKKTAYTSRRKSSRKKSNTAMSVIVIAVIAVITFVISSWKSTFLPNDSESAEGQTVTEVVDADQLLNVKLPDELPSTIVDYTGFTVSFNKDKHVPNYVAWELTAEEANGTLPRVSNFAKDPDVYGCAEISDYRNSGFDRGHMAPAADMKWSQRAMNDCHYLTNMCPQTHGLNAGAWQTLEDNCRNWARRDSAIIIVCGPVLRDKIMNYIGKNEVAVPERFFKVVIAPFANPPRGIGFIMANNETVAGGVQASAMTIDQVEQITGYDFFAALPDDIENDVESQCNYPLWQRKK